LSERHIREDFDKYYLKVLEVKFYNSSEEQNYEGKQSMAAIYLHGSDSKRDIEYAISRICSNFKEYLSIQIENNNTHL
jgi:hypothetical protein